MRTVLKALGVAALGYAAMTLGFAGGYRTAIKVALKPQGERTPKEDKLFAAALTAAVKSSGVYPPLQVVKAVDPDEGTGVYL
jgi:hypothetical protein